MIRIEPGDLVFVALPEDKEMRHPNGDLYISRPLYVAVYSEERQRLDLKLVDWDVARALVPEKLRGLKQT